MSYSPSVSECMASTKRASVGSRRLYRSWPLKLGPAGSKPGGQDQKLKFMISIRDHSYLSVMMSYVQTLKQIKQINITVIFFILRICDQHQLLLTVFAE